MKTLLHTLVVLVFCMRIPAIGQELERDPSKGAVVKTYIISGDTSVPGAIMEGLPGEPRSDMNGQYRAIVPRGWTGIVTPIKEGHKFDPPSRSYEALAEDLTGEDYHAAVVMVTITDRIAVGEEPDMVPIPGVVVTAIPGGNTDITDADGWYSIEVPYGWSGALTMVKDGFDPVPRTISYKDVTTDMLNQRPAASSKSRDTGVPRFKDRGIFSPRSSPLSADEVLVIPTRQVETEVFAQTAEDMRVMAHILREELSAPRTIRGVLYDYGDFFGGPGHPVEAIHLQGYGVLFVVRLETPFSFAQVPPIPARKTPEPTVDPVWQRAQETLRGPQSGRSRWSGQEDRMTFEKLKEDLLQTLKHAANIRHIDPNERVILTVLGQDTTSGISARGPSFSFQGGSGSFSSSSGFGGGQSSSGGAFYSYSGGPGRVAPGGASASAQGEKAPATVLTIQAVKADIDAFAKGDMDFEQFQEKAKVLSY